MKILTPTLAALAILSLSGCLYTSHHYNSGRILDPGNTAVTIGYGKFTLRESSCDYDNGYSELYDSTGAAHCVRYDWRNPNSATYDTASPILREVKLPKFSLGYRLGVRGPWGPFTGLELGWHLEAPTNPGSAEFDLKFGLPAPKSLQLFHSLSGGWIVGMWADNSFFAEYAASRAFGRGDNAHALYASYRLTRLATQPDDVFKTDSLALRFNTRRRLAQQATVGFHIRLPAIPVIPDYLSPQATFSTPWVPVFGDAPPDGEILTDLNIGFGWRF